MLGRIYQDGLGTRADAGAALKWYLKAARKGYVSAQFMAAYVFLSGDAGKIEAFKARVWAELARVHGYEDAALVAEYSEYKLKDSQIERAKKQASVCLESGYQNCP